MKTGNLPGHSATRQYGMLLTTLLLLLAPTAWAQKNVTVRLATPLPFTLRMEDISNVQVSYAGIEPIQVVAKGVATDLLLGVVAAEVETQPFWLHPGLNSFNAGNIPPRARTYIAQPYLYLETSNVFGMGHWGVCVVIQAAGSADPLDTDCIEQEVPGGQLRLLTPKDGAPVPERNPLFQWLNTQPAPEGGVYRIRICKKMYGQTAVEAMANIDFAAQGDLPANIYQYGLDKQELTPGDYCWQVVLLVAGYSFATSPIGAFTVPGPGKIVGYKFHDLNGNGVWEGYPATPWIPGKEPGLQGWTFNLSGPETQTATTDASGRFEFLVRSPGEYTVGEQQQDGWLATTPASQEVVLHVVSGEMMATAPELLFGNKSSTPPPSSCELSTKWELGPKIIGGLLTPRGYIKVPFGKGLAMKADGVDVDYLKVVCRQSAASLSEGEAPQSRCENVEEIPFFSKLTYYWKIEKVEKYVRDTQTQTMANEPLLMGGFRNGRNQSLGLKDEGVQIRYYPPLLEFDPVTQKGEEARVIINVTIKDDDPTKAFPDDDLQFQIWLHIRRSSRDEFAVTIVDAPEPPSKPDLKSIRTNNDCPCIIKKVWKDETPIEVITPSKIESVTGEHLKLETQFSDLDKLVIWCEDAAGNSTEPREFIVHDVLLGTWESTAGAFPASNLVSGHQGKSVVYQNSLQPGDFQLNFSVGDLKLQYVDPVVEKPVPVSLKEHAVIVVPGVMGTSLKYGPKVLWPPEGVEGVIRYMQNWQALQLDGNGGGNLLDLGEVLTTPIFNYQMYGFLGDELERKGHRKYYCPYDWRREIRTKCTPHLENRVNVALKETQNDKVSIVGHSMGGLVSRAWLLNYAEAEQKVDQIFFLGTPHHGAPNAFRQLRWGSTFWVNFSDFGFGWVTGGMNQYLGIEHVKEMVSNWPGLYELLPTKEWFSAGGIFDDQFGYNDSEKRGILGNMFETYTGGEGDWDDAWLPNEKMVTEAIDFHKWLLKPIPNSIFDYNVYSADLPTEWTYQLEGPSLGAVLGQVFPLYDRIVKTASQVFYGIDSDYADSGNQRLYVGKSEGDGTVPTHSARWAYGPKNWIHEYQARESVHRNLQADSKIHRLYNLHA